VHFQGIENKMGLTGSGEVHNPLGSLKLPRRLDHLFMANVNRDGLPGFCL